MEKVLDIIWIKILAFIHYASAFLDTIFSPLNYLGPTLAVFLIAFLTVALTKLLSRFKTKRYRALKEDFNYWFRLRQESLKTEDREKGKDLARNIDQAKLNKAYYDFFFEGFLLNIATRYLPILIFLAYVNEAYKPQNLAKAFGKESIFRINTLNGDIVSIGASAWFVISILIVYLGWFITRKIVKR